MELGMMNWDANKDKKSCAGRRVDRAPGCRIARLLASDGVRARISRWASVSGLAASVTLELLLHMLFTTHHPSFTPLSLNLTITDSSQMRQS